MYKIAPVCSPHVPQQLHAMWQLGTITAYVERGARSGTKSHMFRKQCGGSDDSCSAAYRTAQHPIFYLSFTLHFLTLVIDKWDQLGIDVMVHVHRTHTGLSEQLVDRAIESVILADKIVANSVACRIMLAAMCASTAACLFPSP
jgi:hypothetical protein